MHARYLVVENVDDSSCIVERDNGLASESPTHDCISGHDMQRSLCVLALLCFKLIGRENGRESKNVGLVDGDKRRGHVELPVVAHDRITHIHNVGIASAQRLHDADDGAQEADGADVAWKAYGR